MLLVIDQWEELHTLCDDERARTLFVDQVLDATRASPLTVVLTLRADFYGLVLEHRQLSDRLQGSLLNLGPMTEDELHEATTRPAARASLQFETGLADRIVRDLGRGPGTLPLLEFVLSALWDGRTGRQLTHATYEALGGAHGAIAQWADSVLHGLSVEEQTRARTLLTELVQIGEASQDTRRRMELQEIRATLLPVARQLVAKRILVTGTHASGVDTIELAHDTLIENWGTLEGWVEEDRSSLLLRRRLSEARIAWERADRDPLALLAGVRLLEAQRLLENTHIDLPPSDTAFLRQSLRRHRRQLVVKRMVVGALVCLLIVATGTSYVALSQQKRAEQETLSQKETTDFLINLFESVDPAATKGKPLTAREVVDKGARQLDAALRRKPATRATLLLTVGSVYRNLGLYEPAIRYTTKALAIRMQLYGPSHADVAEAVHSLGVLRFLNREYAKAERLLRDALATREGLLGSRHASVAESLASLADCLVEEAKGKEAEELARRALALQRRYHAGDKAAIASTLNALGRLLDSHSPEAESLLREALALRVQLSGYEDPEVVVSLNNLASLLWRRGEFAASEALLRRALEINRKLLYPRHPRLVISINNMGLILAAQKRYREAEPLYEEALAMGEALGGPDDPAIATTLNNLSTLYYHTKDYSRAEAASSRALTLRIKEHGESHPAVAESLTNLALIQKAGRRYEAAELNLRKGLALEQALYGDGHEYVAVDMANLAFVLKERGQFAEARDYLGRAIAARRALARENDATLREWQERLREIEALAETAR